MAERPKETFFHFCALSDETKTPPSVPAMIFPFADMKE
jgi:hypothetical protein